MLQHQGEFLQIGCDQRDGHLGGYVPQVRSFGDFLLPEGTLKGRNQKVLSSSYDTKESPIVGLLLFAFIIFYRCW